MKNIIEQLNNIYVIDTKMAGFDHYNSAYLVKGEKLALIDTGYPSRIDVVRKGIRECGFKVSDISYIFVTHCEHLDHSGNVAPLLRESPDASVYIHAAGAEFLTNPEVEMAKQKLRLPAQMFARIGEMEAVPQYRIKYLSDGDEFDLGDDEKLKVIFARGHAPSGIVIQETKNNGLFINDLVGNYFSDAVAHYPLTPPRSDSKQIIQTLKELMKLQVKYLFLGHYGICSNPEEIISRAIENVQWCLDIGMKCIAENKSGDIASRLSVVFNPELEKLRKVRGEAVYKYASQEHIPSQLKAFTKYCEDAFL